MKSRHTLIILIGVFLLVGIMASCMKDYRGPLNTEQEQDETSDNTDTTSTDTTDTTPTDTTSTDTTETTPPSILDDMADSLKTYLSGSHYYLLYLDSAVEEVIDSEVVEDYRVNIPDNDMQVFLFSSSYKKVTSDGLNSFGLEADWFSVETAGPRTWVNGAISHNDTTDFTGITDDYVFHFAIKSNNDTVTYVLSLGYGSQNGDQNAGFGADIKIGSNADAYTNFPRDGKWHHIEIPISALKVLEPGFNFDNKFSTDDNWHLIGFKVLTGGDVPAGIPLNLDAVFYYLPK